MKSRLTVCGMILLMLAACGQTGDLYLPDKPPPSVLKRKREKDELKNRQQPAVVPTDAEPAPAPPESVAAPTDLQQAPPPAGRSMPPLVAPETH